ncbi:MAG: hypothetical protein LBM78_00915 [Clostridiales bacterium]|jgi:hypothetical protein|nr:hypothetical protein [Clostridiales bacterium]
MQAVNIVLCILGGAIVAFAFSWAVALIGSFARYRTAVDAGDYAGAVARGKKLAVLSVGHIRHARQCELALALLATDDPDALDKHLAFLSMLGTGNYAPLVQAIRGMYHFAYGVPAEGQAIFHRLMRSPDIAYELICPRLDGGKQGTVTLYGVFMSLLDAANKHQTDPAGTVGYWTHLETQARFGFERAFIQKTRARQTEPQ